LASISGPPPTLSPGQALYLEVMAPVSLETRDRTLCVRYYHQDHLGSSSVMTDARGALIQEAAYYPFGASRNTYKPRQVEEPYQFTQKERDHESGLQYFEARFLAGALGRFTRVDPLAGLLKTAWLLNPQRLNLYAYAQNQPMLYVDPTGQDPELQEVMSASFESQALSCGGAKTAEGCVDRLSNREFAALTSVYERMKERGLSKYIEYVTGFGTAGELSITFSISDESAFKDALFGVNRKGDPFDYSSGARGFSQDPGFYNKFHKGSESFREISATDSLHISVYNKNHVTAHIDRDSPVALDTGPITSMDPVRGLRHQGREAGGPQVGATVLGWFHVPESISLSPGMQFFPDQPLGRGERPGIYYVGFGKDF
jgi:RHS repeat-associated protein